MDRLLGKLAVLAILGMLASFTPAGAADLTVFSVTPAFSPYNAASQTITIRGVGFSGSTTVAIDGLTAAVAFVDGRTLEVTVPTVPSERVSTVVVEDPVSGMDEFYPFLYTGPVIYVATTGDDVNAGTDPNLHFRGLGRTQVRLSLS